MQVKLIANHIRRKTYLPQCKKMFLLLQLYDLCYKNLCVCDIFKFKHQTWECCSIRITQHPIESSNFILPQQPVFLLILLVSLSCLAHDGEKENKISVLNEKGKCNQICLKFAFG